MSLISKLKRNLWLTQTVKDPVGFKNPFGDPHYEDGKNRPSFSLEDVFKFNYMGAAEYEHHHMKEYFDRMIKNANKLNIYQHFYSKNNKQRYIYILTDNFYKAYMGIDFAYNKTKEYIRENMEDKGNNITKDIETSAHYPMIFKNEYGSWYKTMVNHKDMQKDPVKGWLIYEEDFAWFIDSDMAKRFHGKLLDAHNETNDVNVTVVS